MVALLVSRFHSNMASNTWKKVVVFFGSTRDTRLGDRVAKFVIRKLEEKKLEVTYVGKLLLKKLLC